VCCVAVAAISEEEGVKRMKEKILMTVGFVVVRLMCFIAVVGGLGLVAHAWTDIAPVSVKACSILFVVGTVYL